MNQRLLRHSGWAICLALILTAILVPASCQDDDLGQEAKAPAPDEVVARIGEMEFTELELNEHLEFLKGADPSLSDGYIRHYLLMQVLVPQRLLQRELDAEVVSQARQKSEDLARAVKSAGADLDSLKRYGEPLGGQESPFPLFRTNDLEIQVARAVFGLEIGEVSGAIHATWGSYVLAPTKRVPGVAGSAESRTVYAVFFPYSRKSGFKSRILGEAARFRKTLLEIHSRYFRELRPLATDIRILSK